MTIRHLNTFVTVCECESITGAAKKLFISQPAVSITIRELENEYGVKLFERSTRKRTLTEIGNEIYKHSKKILAMFDDMRLEITDKKTHQALRVGAGIAFGKLMLPALVQEFKSQKDNCEIYITIDSSEVIEPMISLGELDIAFMEGTTHSPVLERFELSSSPIVAVCHKDHIFAKNTKITPSMLASENLLLRERRSPTRDAVNSYFSQHGLSFRPKWESSSALALLEAANEKHGIAILPLDHFCYFKISDLVVLNVPTLQCSRKMYVVFRKGFTINPLGEEFISHTRKFILDREVEIFKNLKDF